MNDPITYPIRINHYLALNNVASRREADKIIAAGKVFINGRIAVLGDKVNEGDKVELAGNEGEAGERRYFAYHKPRGTALENSKIKTESRKAKTLFAMDRLDKDTAGLVIVSNDPQAKDILANPRFHFSETFIVRVHRPLGNEFFDKVKKGGESKKGAIESLEQTGPKVFEIKINRTSLRELRELVTNANYEITSLVRVGTAGVSLNNQKEDTTRELKGPELETFLATIQ